VPALTTADGRRLTYRELGNGWAAWVTSYAGSDVRRFKP
jgi:hypothetical protein